MAPFTLKFHISGTSVHGYDEAPEYEQTYEWRLYSLHKTSKSFFCARRLLVKKRSSLERKMLNYVVLIAAASLLITVEFLRAIGQVIPRSDLPPLDAIENVKHGMEFLRSKALLMFVVQAVETLIILIMFIRKITNPLQRMVEEASIICSGDLTRTIPVRCRDEIGLIGETINSLTCNIQEMTAPGLYTEESLRLPLAGLKQRLIGEPVSTKKLDDMEAGLDTFKYIAKHMKMMPGPFDTEEEVRSCQCSY